jgi:hypothetical protein
MNPTICICPYCELRYSLGCDVCLSIVRNPLDHSILEEEDTLTDMEKA